MSEFIFEASDETFDSEVLKHNGAVLVDFWAEWCGPCKALGPVLEGLADEYKEKIKVVKVNVDESPNAPQAYKVRGIPTMVFFRNGQLVEQLVGNQPREAIKGVIEKVLK
ncbi:MAG: thioredoxin [Proteobacteria bacterium]|nr:MAG: thioredoxin [Pseudomonadota bacterium]